MATFFLYILKSSVLEARAELDIVTLLDESDHVRFMVAGEAGTVPSSTQSDLLVLVESTSLYQTRLPSPGRESSACVMMVPALMV
ncbi:MAG: hypothetical protein BWY32_03460 [bacterium ADurb.Bin243]|nr:MAG: hypothetical protein BWY32_03460 [bacterium ADurb.Bin243]